MWGVVAGVGVRVPAVAARAVSGADAFSSSPSSPSSDGPPSGKNTLGGRVLWGVAVPASKPGDVKLLPPPPPNCCCCC